MAVRSSDFGHAVLLSWGWRRSLLAFGAGAVSALGLAPFGWLPLLWLTMPVFVWLLDGSTSEPGAGMLRRLMPAFATGWCFGFGYFLAGLWWIGAAFLADSGTFIWLMPVAVLLLPAGLALFWGAGAAVARLCWPEGWPRVLMLAITLSLAEWLRGTILTGFPWNAFGYTLMPSPLFMQIASVIGTWGVTLLAFLVFCAPVLVLGPRPAKSRGDLVLFIVIAVLFLGDMGFGAGRLLLADSAMVPGVRLRLVQPMVAEDQKWSPGRDDEILGRYLSLSASGMEAGKPAPFTHLIWPETALPFFLTDRPNALASIGAMLPQGTTLLMGAARTQPVLGDETDAKVFNSLYVIGDDGSIRDAYDKVHLVPFGEYLPFESILRSFGLRQMISLPGGFDAGTRQRSVPLADAPSFAPLICYEIIFPGFAVDREHRPGWLVNVTNDAWFGDTPGPRQHFQQAIVRAVEEGLPLARAANSGISGIVDPYGRLIATRPLGTVGVVDGPLPLSLRPTYYSRWGNVVYFGLCILLALVIATVSFTRTKQRN